MPDEIFAADDGKQTYIEYLKNRAPRWNNVFGEPVDLDNIDRDYALNIYTMVVTRRARAGYGRDDFMEDRMLSKLREVILEGRKPSARDKLRAKVYNARNRVHGLPYRAG